MQRNWSDYERSEETESVYAVTSRQQSRRNVHPTFFGFCLTTDTLAFGEVLPAAEWVRDFHPLERALTGRTKTARSFAFASLRAVFLVIM